MGISTVTIPVTKAKAKGHWCKEHDCAFDEKQGKHGPFFSHPTDDPKYPKGWCNEIKKKGEAPAPEPEPAEEPPQTIAGKDFIEKDWTEEEAKLSKEKGFMDLGWLEESLQILRDKKLTAWSESNLLNYMKTAYHVEAETVLEAASKLDKGGAAHFTTKIQKTLEMA